jgi:NADH-quinone oxidoreductase subunit I
MEQPPHAMRLGNSEKDYYLGALTNPGTSAGAERAGGVDAAQPGMPLSRGAA